MDRLRLHITQRPWLLSILLAVAFLPIKLYGSDCSYLNMHAARDWERGWQMWHGVRAWWNGPELLFRGSIPGCFFNLLTGLFQIPSRNPLWAAMGPGILFCIAIGFFHDGMRRVFGDRVALWCALLYGAQPLGTIALRYLWNPAYLFVFAAIALWCVARAIRERNGGWMAGALTSLLLAVQIHLSVYAAVGAVVVIMLRFRLFPRWWQWLAVIAIYTACVAPYFFNQWRDGWPDRAMQRQTALDSQIDVSRFKVNPLFFPPFGVQIFVQYLGYPQTFPFSYYERFYQASPTFRRIGKVAFLVTAPLVLLLLAGVARAFSRPGADDEGAIARRRYTEAATIYLVGCCLPHLLWNPRAQGIFADHFGVPIRYLLILWPSQWVLMGAALSWGFERTPFVRRALAAWLAAMIALCLVVTVLFNYQARRSGEPFNYLFYQTMPVHALRDKVALAEHLVTKWGVDEQVLQDRVHTADSMMLGMEESMDYEIRAALEHHPSHPKADPGVFYFLCKPRDLPHVKGDAETLESRDFGGVGLVVYRPNQDLGRWQVDAPLSWWWF